MKNINKWLKEDTEAQVVDLNNRNIDFIKKVEDTLGSNAEMTFLLQQNLKEMQSMKEELDAKSTENNSMNQRVKYLNDLITASETQVADLLMQSN